jgi:hypothetical protein
MNPEEGACGNASAVKPVGLDLPSDVRAANGNLRWSLAPPKVGER